MQPVLGTSILAVVAMALSMMGCHSSQAPDEVVVFGTIEHIVLNTFSLIELRDVQIENPPERLRDSDELGVRFHEDVPILRESGRDSSASASRGDLEVGARIRVRAGETTMLSSPPQVTARSIEIIQPRQ